MTVPSLYNKLKLDILKSTETDISSNIKTLDNDAQVELEGVFDETSVNGAENVPVDYNFGDLQRSKELQKNVLIVIIDPNDSEAEVSRKINSYNALTEKFKRLSDSYSFEFYGFNVRNMYKLVMSGLLTADVEEEEEGIRNTIVVGESTNLKEPLSDVENFESIVEGCKDFMNEAYINNDILHILKYESTFNYEKDPQIYRVIERKIDDLTGKAKILSTPSTSLPWYTPREMLEMGITPHIDPNKRYLLQVNEAMEAYKEHPCNETANRVLELGWNYEVDVNPSTIKAAKAHYMNEMSKVEVYDIRSFNEYDIVERNENDPIPVYVACYDNGIRLSLDPDMMRAVSPTGSEPIDINCDAKVFVTFVKSMDDIDLERFKSYETLKLYDKALKYDFNRELANKVIDSIVQLCKKPIIAKTYFKTFLVYEGPMSEYDFRRTDEIVDTLLHHVDELLADNGIVNENIVAFAKSVLKPSII
jgi:hypothetical protein